MCGRARGDRARSLGCRWLPDRSDIEYQKAMVFGGDKAPVGGSAMALARHPILGFVVLSLGFAGVTLYEWHAECLIAPPVTFLDGDYDQWTLGIGTAVFVLLPALIFLAYRVFRCYYTALRVLLAIIIAVGSVERAPNFL